MATANADTNSAEIAVHAAPPPRSRSSVVFVASFSLLLLIEFILFDQVGAHQVTGIYPRWNDQIQYLSECYTGYEYARGHGILAGLWQTVVNPSAQGTLHDAAALLVFQLVGPSRSAALALNMLALMAWQGALGYAAWRRTGFHLVAAIAALLPLALHGPWENIPGSAYDFRLDHLAMCALGVAGATALLTDQFRSRRWSLVFGLAVAVALLTRFITGTYFVVIFVALLGWVAFSADRRTRTVNLLLSTVVAAGLAAPIFWVNREWVLNYYYIGHYIGPESAIRNQNFGLWRSTEFIWRTLAERHLGMFFGLVVVCVAAVFAALRFHARTLIVPEAVSRRGSAGRAGEWFVFGAVFLLAPALVLTVHPQKSEVVLSALVPGVTLLTCGLWIMLGSAVRTDGWISIIVGVLAMLAVIGYFGRRQFRPLESPDRLADLRQVNTLADYVFIQSEAAHLSRPRVAVDNVTAALDARVLRVICYERHHVWKDFDLKLPTGITEPAADLVRQRVAESDFVFLGADDAPAGPFPYDRKLVRMRPELRAWCDSHLCVAHRFTFAGHPVVLYVQPALAKYGG